MIWIILIIIILWWFSLGVINYLTYLNQKELLKNSGLNNSLWDKYFLLLLFALFAGGYGLWMTIRNIQEERDHLFKFFIKEIYKED